MSGNVGRTKESTDKTRAMVHLLYAKDTTGKTSTILGNMGYELLLVQLKVLNTVRDP